MCSIVQTLKCQHLNEHLNVGAMLIYIGLDAIITRELPNYIDCTVQQ